MSPFKGTGKTSTGIYCPLAASENSVRPGIKKKHHKARATVCVLITPGICLSTVLDLIEGLCL